MFAQRTTFSFVVPSLIVAGLIGYITTLRFGTIATWVFGAIGLVIVSLGLFVYTTSKKYEVGVLALQGPNQTKVVDLFAIKVGTCATLSIAMSLYGLLAVTVPIRRPDELAIIFIVLTLMTVVVWCYMVLNLYKKEANRLADKYGILIPIA